MRLSLPRLLRKKRKPPCSSLRISCVKKSRRSITDWKLHHYRSRSPTQRHDVENVASAGANPAASTISACKL